MVNSWSDTDGRYLQCEFSYLDKTFRVVCLYAPNRNPARDQFFDDLIHKIDPLIPTILSGDFNAVFDRSMDRQGSDASDSSRESSSSLANLFLECCVIDIWRYVHPSVPGYTWTRWNGSLAFRIDLFGVPYVWVPSISSVSVLPCSFSDHCAVLLSVNIPDAAPPGPGFWKLNASILEDSDYVQLVNNTWKSWRRSVSRFPNLAK